MNKRKMLISAACVAMLVGATPGMAYAENVVTMLAGQIFRSLDPAKISDYTDYLAAVNLYDGLTSVEPDGTIVPELAESWTVSDDTREVTYTLRADAKFSDGSPVEASDVVYTVERLLRINQGPASMLADVIKPGSVTAVDARTIKFTLAKTFAPFLSIVPAIFILNEEAVKPHEGTDDAQEWLATNAAGAGPYMVKKYDRGAGLTVVRSKDYYKGFAKNPIDEVRFLVLTDAATVRSLAASGEMTMTGPFESPDTLKSLADMGYRIQEDPSTSVLYLKLNSRIAPTDDVHIRRAIALATDYKTVREVIFPGDRLTTPLPETFKQFHAGDIPEPTFDLEAAKAEVAKSKYAGKPIPISLGYVAGLKFEEEISLMLQANLEQIGFTVKQEANPWNRITELSTKVETTPAVNQIFWSATYPSPDSMFFTQYHSSANGTFASVTWTSDPDVDRLIEGARETGNVDEQVKLYKELQHRLVDMQSDVFLVTQRTQHAIHKCLSGLTVIPMRSFGYDFSRYSWTCN